MTRASYVALQAKIEKEISKLKKKAEALHSKRRKPVIVSIVASMRDYQITPEEIVAAFNANNKPARKTAGAKLPTAAKRPVAAKYRHPSSGETWSGRGKPPRWLAAEEAAGKSRDSFLITE